MFQIPTAPQHNKIECVDAKYIDLLSKIATNLAPTGAARVAAAIVYKKSIVAFGTNSAKTHPFQAKYSRNPKSIHLHAETDAIKNALRILSQEELCKSTLYVCRVKYIDKTKRKLIFGLAKPCDGCLKAIVNFNIKKVIYSLDNEGYSTL